MKIVAVSGNAGSGKDFITLNLLVPMLTNGQSYVIVSFADHFKFDAIVKDKLDRTKVYGRKDKETRVYLQQKGVEQGRDIYGDNIWIDLLNERLLQYQARGIKYAFITDCRFPNEIKYVESKGGFIIRIEAPDRHEAAMKIEEVEIVHSSENALQDTTEWKYLVNNTVANQKNVATEVAKICNDIAKSFKYPETVFCNLDYYIEEKFLTMKEKVKELFERENILILWNFNFSQNDTFLSDEEFFIKMLNGHRDSLIPQIKDIVSCNIPHIQQACHEVLHLSTTTNVVIVTRGNIIHQTRRLFDMGIFGLPIEYISNDEQPVYDTLMKKYPSRRFKTIKECFFHA